MILPPFPPLPVDPPLPADLPLLVQLASVIAVVTTVAATITRRTRMLLMRHSPSIGRAKCRLRTALAVSKGVIGVVPGACCRVSCDAAPVRCEDGVDPSRHPDLVEINPFVICVCDSQVTGAEYRRWNAEVRKHSCIAHAVKPRPRDLLGKAGPSRSRAISGGKLLTDRRVLSGDERIPVQLPLTARSVGTQPCITVGDAVDCGLNLSLNVLASPIGVVLHRIFDRRAIR